MKQQVVVVLGMHRSGTSAITAGLQTLGADIGTQSEHLRPPEVTSKDTNRKGFFELNEIVYWHDVLLNAMGSHWSDWSSFKEGWRDTDQALEVEEHLKDFIVQRFGEASLWGFKDPRTCRFISMWQSILTSSKMSPYGLIVVRNPMAVARSLFQRDGMGLGQALQLWMRYNVDAVLGSSGWRRVVVDYDAWLTHPSDEMTRVAQHLALPIPDQLAVDRYAQDFLDTTMRHHHVSDSSLVRGAIPPYIQDLFNALSDASRDVISDNELIERTCAANELWEHDEGWHLAGVYAHQGLPRDVPVGHVRWDGGVGHGISQNILVPRAEGDNWSLKYVGEIHGPGQLDIIMPAGTGWLSNLQVSAIDLEDHGVLDTNAAPLESYGMVPIIGQGRWAKISANGWIRWSITDNRKLHIKIEAIWTMAANESMAYEISKVLLGRVTN